MKRGWPALQAASAEAGISIPEFVARAFEATTGISTAFSGNRRDCTCTTAPDGTVTAQCPPRIECD